MRERLPDRRRSETFDFDMPVGTTVLHYTATVSYYSDGRVGELFLNNHKSNSTADTNARDAAIAFSFAVQHGANIEDIRKALCRETDGRASGPLRRTRPDHKCDRAWSGAVARDDGVVP